MSRFLILILALVAGLFAQTPKPSAAVAPGSTPTATKPAAATKTPVPLKSAALSKDLQDELTILELAAQHLKAQADAAMAPLNAKFEAVRKQACEQAKIADANCGITQGPQGLIVQEKPQPPEPQK